MGAEPQFRGFERDCCTSMWKIPKHLGAPSMRMILDLALALRQRMFLSLTFAEHRCTLR
jgi:hypothetical protein